MKKAINIWILLFMMSTVSYGQVNDFTLTNSVDGNEVSLKFYLSKKAVVVIFTSNYCPFSKLYDARIKSMASKYGDVQFLLINSNSSSASRYDTIEEMAKRAKENKYPYPYLADKEQQVSTNFGATKTPEAFLLKPSNSKFNIIYRGAIDDNPQIADDVSKHYLRNAIEEVLMGEEASVKSTRPTGCIIKR